MTSRWHGLFASMLVGCTCAPVPPVQDAGRGGPVELHGLSAAQAAVVLCQIDGEPVTALDLAEELASRGDLARLVGTMPAQRRAVLDRMVDRRLLADEARRTGLMDDPEVARVRREVLTRAVGDRWLGDLDVPDPGEAALRARHAAERARFRQPELVRARFIAFADRAQAEVVLAEALSVRRLDEAWRGFAARGLVSPVVDANQEFGPFAHPDLGRPEDASVPPAVGRAAFETPAGTLHPQVVEAGALYYLVWPITRTPPTEIAFEVAASQLRSELHRERVADALETIALHGRRIEIDEDALALVQDPPSAPVRPSPPR